MKETTTLENPDFRLEQAEYKVDSKICDVVVSYLVENTNPKNNPFSAISTEFKYHRIYKKIKINENKSVIGLYM